MSEIEKMYSNVGVNKETECDEPYDVCSKDWECDTCPYANNYYPPFTAEKQIEIVKMILFSTWWLNLKRLQFSEKFDEGLAQMINELWQDLSEEEKQQVKGILE